MLDNVKLLLGISDTEKDRLLELLILQCTDYAMDYTHQDCPDILQSVIEQMVIYRYNSLGVENLKSESYSGISYSYMDDYPEHLIKMLKKYRKLVTL